MANLTLAIDDAVLKQARIRALEEDTTVNALVREFLEGYAEEAIRAGWDRFLTVAEEIRRDDVPPSPRTWTRDDLYEERLGRLR